MTSVAIGAGALAASALVRLDVAGVDPLALPLLVGLAVQLVGLLAVLALVDEPRHAGGWRAAARSAAAVPHVVGGALRAIRSSRTLVALATAELLWGFGMVAFETFFPARFADRLGDADRAASLLGPVVTLAWVLSALGAAAAPALARRLGAGRAACVLRLAHGATVVAMGVAAGPVGMVAGYLATYAVHGATGPVHYGMVHRAVDGEHRATVVSANSLTSQVGGAASGIVLGALADAHGLSIGMLAAAVVLAAAAPLYLVRDPAPARSTALPTAA